MPTAGAIGRQLIASLQELLEARGLSFRRASAALDELGRPIPPLGFSRIIKGERRVDVDELVVLSLLLGVTPSALLLPRDADGAVVVALAPGARYPAAAAWAWADGRLPLDGDLDWFRRYARPKFVNVHESDPAFREASGLAGRIAAALAEPDKWDTRREDVIRGFQLLRAVLDDWLAKRDADTAFRGAWEFAPVQLPGISQRPRPPLFGLPADGDQ